ncbi:MAG: penicillin-binding protein 2 [Gammaproteobacteria bacterium]|nr:penicillin-binding protein 2 [Gammaproteobacteria bacterium]
MVYRKRLHFITAIMTLVVGLLLARALDLHIFSKDFLQEEGAARHLRTVSLNAHRGMITDRHGEPLAVSTPVDSVWINPREFKVEQARWPELARILEISRRDITNAISGKENKEFVYIKRRVDPDIAARVKKLKMAGVYLQREYRRYYPAGEVAGHVIGFNNIDDYGQEGLELAFNDWLAGKKGSKKVIKDRLGHIVEDVEHILSPEPGKDLTLSIDRRIQYLTYRELKAAVQAHGARSGAAVVLDARTSEVLAMVNQPSFNPNNRTGLHGTLYRNRAATDVFEPGSTIKPFTVAAALKSGRHTESSIINTSPGFYKLGDQVVKDVRDYGQIDLSTVIQKSSNVGASLLALSLQPGEFWETFALLGFGAPTGGGFPGESYGLLRDYASWSPFEQATMSFGYGLSVTPLQLAHAYTTLANDGRLRPVSFLKMSRQQADAQASDPVFSLSTIHSVRQMMQGVVTAAGTGKRARIAGYRVAGKTGTVKKSSAEGGYTEDKYLAVFAGMVPASNPRLVMVVMVDEPSRGEYYGGRVAAPVFSRVMSGALRLLDIPPDDLDNMVDLSAPGGSA